MNHKRTYKLYRELGLQLRNKTPKRRVKAKLRDDRHPATRPNEVWAMDFLYDQLSTGTKIRVLTVVDTFSRFSPVLDARLSYRGEDVVQTLDRVCSTIGYPVTIRVDQGSEFVSRDLDIWDYARGVTLDFSRPGKPTDNAFAEAFNSRVRAECMNAHWFLSLADAREKLKANADLCSPSVKLHGAGFIITPAQATGLGLGHVNGLDQVIRPYVHGRDLSDRTRGVLVIDLYPLSETNARLRFPAVYQHVLTHVKPDRDANNERFRRDYWWWFGRTHELYRSFTLDLRRYIATPETAKHRWFVFLGEGVRADNRLVAFGLSDAFELGVLTSRRHVAWTLANGGRLEDRPIYTKTVCFDRFPFPPATEEQKAVIRDLAEELDALRKDVIAKRDFLTMTKLYNIREKLVSGELFAENERIIYEEGRVGVIHELHNRIDAAVADAYG